MNHIFSIIVAYDANTRMIGIDGKLPWSMIPEDMNYFYKITHGKYNPEGDETSKPNIVIMGRVTWESIPDKKKPLRGRINFVLSSEASNEEYKSLEPNKVYWFNSWESIDKTLDKMSYGEIFVIGGSQLFDYCLSGKQLFYCFRVYITELYGFNTGLYGKKNKDSIDDRNLAVIGGSYFPPIDFIKNPCFITVSMTEPEESNAVEKLFYRFNVFRVIKPEQQYLQMLGTALMSPLVENRTGISAYTMISDQLTFDLDWGFPLLTTKRIFWKGVVEELFWFLRGSTNTKELSEKGIHFWDANSSRKYLDQHNLGNLEEGDIGPGYGFQWRHFGANYKDEKGWDQIAFLEKELKENPKSRRIILTAWNPAQIHEMALPPCHVLYHFFVTGKRLHCHMFQRSADIFLGLPFNIASTALLTTLLASTTGFQPGIVTISISIPHLYKNHLKSAKTQIQRLPGIPPTLKILKQHDTILDYTLEDLEIEDYTPLDNIPAEMVA